jgi:hypothetical protein
MASTAISSLLSIWKTPRSTMRAVLDNASVASFFPLAAIWGIWKNLSDVLRHKVSPDELSAAAIVGINAAFGVAFGIAVGFLFAVVVRWVGKAFGSRANTREVSLVIAWSEVPYVPALVALLLLLAGGGDAMVFNSVSTTSSLSPLLAALASMYTVFALMLGIWSSVIAVIGLSEAGGIGIGRSIAVYLISAAVVVAAVLGTISASMGLLEFPGLGGQG